MLNILDIKCTTTSTVRKVKGNYIKYYQPCLEKQEKTSQTIMGFALVKQLVFLRSGSNTGNLSVGTKDAHSKGLLFLKML